MLLLDRKPHSPEHATFYIGDDITVTVVEVNGRKTGAVKLAIHAPREVSILRADAVVQQPKDYAPGEE